MVLVSKQTVDMITAKKNPRFSKERRRGFGAARPIEPKPVEGKFV